MVFRKLHTGTGQTVPERESPARARAMAFRGTLSQIPRDHRPRDGRGVKLVPGSLHTVASWKEKKKTWDKNWDKNWAQKCEFATLSKLESGRIGEWKHGAKMMSQWKRWAK